MSSMSRWLTNEYEILSITFSWKLDLVEGQREIKNSEE